MGNDLYFRCTKVTVSQCAIALLAKSLAELHLKRLVDLGVKERILEARHLTLQFLYRLVRVRQQRQA